MNEQELAMLPCSRRAAAAGALRSVAAALWSRRRFGCDCSGRERWSERVTAFLRQLAGDRRATSFALEVVASGGRLSIASAGQAARGSGRVSARRACPRRLRDDRTRPRHAPEDAWQLAISSRSIPADEPPG